MNRQQIITFCLMGLGLLLGGFGALLRRQSRRLAQAAEPNSRKPKRMRTWGLLLGVAGIWLFLVKLLPLVFGAPHKEELSVEISAPRVMLGNLSVSSTIITSWFVMAALILLALLARIFIIPRMADIPRGIQNVLELMVDSVKGYTNSQTHHLGEGLSSYIFTVAALMVGCAFVELFGVRAPTADITMTFALALVTFFLINFYGIREKGFKGRIKSLASPTPIMLILRVLSDIALPVSMACRLFGNMLAGMIVMDLLYQALGSSAIGIPSVIGLYFNIFHPLIQTFIFVTLTLTFINEAAE